MLPGFFIGKVLAVVNVAVFRNSLMLIVIGLLVVCFSKNLAGIVAGVVVAGLGYGIAQPCVYDRTAAVASGDKVTYAMALVMTMNYVAIVIAPFVIELVQKMLGVKSERFPFVFNALLGLVALLVLALVMVYKKRRPLNHE